MLLQICSATGKKQHFMDSAPTVSAVFVFSQSLKKTDSTVGDDSYLLKTEMMDLESYIRPPTGQEWLARCKLNQSQ